MKATFLLFVLCAVFATISCLPAAEEVEQPQQPSNVMNFPWYNPIGYEYMMCRMSCKQNCMEQGYWRGACKQGECFCYGFLGNSFSKMKDSMIPMFYQ